MNHRTREAIITIQTGRGKLKPAVTYLRDEAPFPDQVNVIRLFSVNPPAILPNFSGKRFAKTLPEIWSPNGLPSPQRPQKMIGWLSAGLVAEAEHLNEHLVLRDSIVRLVMLGAVGDAEELLKRHHSKFGHTLWAMRCAFMIAEETGSKASERLLAEYQVQSGDSGVSLFPEHFAKATNKSLTESRYRGLTAAQFKGSEMSGFFDLVFLTDFSDQNDVNELCQWIECLPLVDRYEQFTRLAVLAIGARHETGERFLKEITRISAAVADPVTRFVLECSDESINVFSSPSLFQAWDEYIQGNYQESRELSNAISLDWPWLIPAHEIAVKSSMHSGLEGERRARNPNQEIRNHLYNVFSRNSDFDDSLSSILRLATRLDILPLTAALRSLHAQHTAPIWENRWQSVAVICFGIHGPRNFEHEYPPQKCRAYLSRCLQSNADSSSAQFFLDLDNGTSIDLARGGSAVPDARRVFFGGIAAARHQRFSDALAYLHRFQQYQDDERIRALAPYAIEEARRVMTEVYRRTGSFKELLSLIVEAYMERPHSIRRLPVEAIYEECSRNKRECARYIEYPIVSSLALSDPHAIALDLKRFLRMCSVEFPSHLIKSQEWEPTILGVLFLKVCTSDVLDSIAGLDSAQRVDFERLTELEWVKNAVPSMSNLAKLEIATLTQNAELRDALDNLNQAKVVLDLNGLRTAEHMRFAEAYARFQDQREVAQSRAANELVSALLDLRAAKRTPQHVTISNPEEHKISAFIEAFRDITRGFLSSPYYGLESSLSGQIRHGIIIQYIRNPLLERRLAYRIDSAGPVEVTDYWSFVTQLPRDEPILKSALQILDRLTTEIDHIAQEVKENWVQSKVEPDAPGMFDYAFSDSEIRSIYYQHDFANASQDSFLDLVFDVLLKRTRESLKKMRTEIKNTLRKRLLDAVDSAIAQINPYDTSGLLSPVKNALTSCRQDIEANVCSEMVRWFQESNTSLMGDCDFDLIARTAIGMIERLNPRLKGKFQSSVDSEFSVRGRHFRALVLMIFFLLDNAVQHSKVPDALFKVHVHINAKSNKLEIEVQGVMSDSDSSRKAAFVIRERIEQHLRDFVPERVIREGGSGLAKLIATIIYEVRQSKPTIVARAEDEKLSVTVLCEMAGLAV